MTDEQAEFRPSRRIVFNGMAALGVAVALAGCGSDNTGGTTSTKTNSPGGAGTGAGSGSGLKAGTELAKTTDIPVNGGLILPDQKIVITQETSGAFKAFTAVCTHQGFTVTSVEGDLIKCNHHGSEYNAASGAVVHGPAPAALATIAIAVKGGAIVAA